MSLLWSVAGAHNSWVLQGSLVFLQKCVLVTILYVSSEGLCDKPCQLSPIEKTYCRHADYNFQRGLGKKTCCCKNLSSSKIAFNFGLCFLLTLLKKLSRTLSAI